MKKLVCLMFIFMLLFGGLCNVLAVGSPDVASLYRIDCDFIEKSDYVVGLEIADAMKVHILWDAYDERDIIDGEVNFPLVPDHLAMVILTDGLHISQASWEVTSDHSLHVYFYKDDIEPFIESEVVYIIMLRYQDGLYYKLF